MLCCLDSSRKTSTESRSRPKPPIRWDGWGDRRTWPRLSDSSCQTQRRLYREPRSLWTEGCPPIPRRWCCETAFGKLLKRLAHPDWATKSDGDCVAGSNPGTAYRQATRSRVALKRGRGRKIERARKEWEAWENKFEEARRWKRRLRFSRGHSFPRLCCCETVNSTDGLPLEMGGRPSDLRMHATDIATRA